MIRFLRAPLGSLDNLMDWTKSRQRIVLLPKMLYKVTEIESCATMRDSYSDFQLRQKKTEFDPKKLRFGLSFMLFSFFLLLKNWQMSIFFRFWPKMTLIPARGVKGGGIGGFRESKNLRVCKKIEIYAT